MYLMKNISKLLLDINYLEIILLIKVMSYNIMFMILYHKLMDVKLNIVKMIKKYKYRRCIHIILVNLIIYN